MSATGRVGLFAERSSVTIDATATCFYYLLSCDSACSTQAHTHGWSTTSSAALSVNAAYGAYVNSAVVATLGDEARTINAGLRVRVCQAATALPGCVGGVFITDDSLAVIHAKTYDDIINLPGFRVFSSEGQNIGGEVTYRPTDSASFNFVPAQMFNGSIVSNVSQSWLLVVGVGFPAAGFAYSATTISHLETLGGVDAASQIDGESGLSEADYAPATAAVMKAPYPVITSIPLIAVLDSALDAVRSASTGHLGMGRRRLAFPTPPIHDTSTPSSSSASASANLDLVSRIQTDLDALRLAVTSHPDAEHL